MNQSGSGDGSNNVYIVAASKPWHREFFEDRHAHLPGKWIYVDSKVELEAALKAWTVRYVFFLHWNWLVPKRVVDENECVCFHMTDLPFGRGGSPLQNLITRGFVDTQLTALRMVERMDAGPVYAKRRLDLRGRAEDIYLRAAALSWDLVQWIVHAEPQAVPQIGAVVTFDRRTPGESRLPDSGTTSGLYDFIRMLDAPTYPNAFIEHGCFRLEFTNASLSEKGLEARVTIQQIAREADE